MKMTKKEFEKAIKEDPVISLNTDFTVIKANIEWEDEFGGPVHRPSEPAIITISASEMYQIYLNLQVFFDENPEYKKTH